MATHDRLGELLLEAGFIDEAGLELLETQTRGAARRLQDLAVELGFISGAQLTQILSHQLSLPWISPQNIDVTPEVLARLPKDLVRRLKVIPVYERSGKGERTLYVATDDPTNDRILKECAEASGMPVRLMVAAPEDLALAIEAHFGRDSRASPPPPRAIGAVLHAASVAPRRKPPPPPRSGRRPVTDVTELGWDEIESIDTPESEAPAVPVLLLVHAPKGLESRCRDIAGRLGARLLTSDLLEVADVATRDRPTILIVPEDVYAFDRVAFNTLAMKIRAHLVVWADDIDADYLEPLIFASGGRRPGRSEPAPPAPRA